LPYPARDSRPSMRRTNSAICGTSRPTRSRCPPPIHIVHSLPRSCGGVSSSPPTSTRLRR
jgi:hypothetical protein